jgi:5-methylcytosine-specific restriction endonuclease McrA
MAKKKKAVKKTRVKKKKEWALARYLIPAARKIWSYSPLRRSIKQRTRVSIVKGIETFRCEKCRKLVENIEIDHINPIVDPEVGFQDWNTYLNRMFCDPSNLQGICNSCHKLKSSKESAIRKSKRLTK